MKYFADVCHRCGTKVVKRAENDSSDMVKTCDSFLYMCDVKPGEACRPCLQLRDFSPDSARMYCLDCLLNEVSEWIKKMKERGRSNISPKNVIWGDMISYPCPHCGRQTLS